MPDRKAGDFRAVAQCGRRPPDHAQPYGLLERHALLVRDGEAVSGLFPVVDALLADPERMRRMAANIRVLGIADSAERIVDEIVAVVRKN